jgi:hypothetical protein
LANFWPSAKTVCTHGSASWFKTESLLAVGVGALKPRVLLLPLLLLLPTARQPSASFVSDTQLEVRAMGCHSGDDVT